MVAALSLLLLSSLQEISLASLEKAAASVDSHDYEARLKSTAYVNSGIGKLLDDNSLKTGEDFYRAANLYSLTDSSDFRGAQTKYELSLTAISLGHHETAKQLAADWDSFVISTGRPMRIGVVMSSRLKTVPTVKSVILVLKDPKPNANAVTNPEMKEIVDSDQKDRKELQESKNPDSELYSRIATNDKRRLARTKELLEEGAIKSAQDFWNAGLVLQHGESYEDFALAHELAVCALTLGMTKASWLCGATYDRMLLNSGHPQRFATQYEMAPSGGFALSWYDTTRINDVMRTAVVRTTLQQAIEKAKDF